MRNYILFIPFIIIAANWLAGVILFEFLFKKGFFSKVLAGYGKAQSCRAWCIAEIFLYLLYGPAAFMFAILMLWTIGVSHYFLCAGNEHVTVVRVVRNIPIAVKKAAAEIAPYIK